MKVAKYCDEHVCVCVCLSVRQDISGTTHEIFTNFFVHVAYGNGSALLLSSCCCNVPVCLFVCLSHAGTVPKWLNVGSHN